MSSTIYNDIAAGIEDAIKMVQSSTIFVPVYQGRGLWAVKEVERSTGHSLGIVLDDIETQGSAECWAKEYNEIEGDE